MASCETFTLASRCPRLCLAQPVSGELGYSCPLFTAPAVCPGPWGGADRTLQALGNRQVHVLHPPRVLEPVSSGPWPWAEQPRARHLEALRRQLQVELKVKQGAENMTHTCASGTPKVRAPLLGPLPGARGWHDRDVYANC